MDSKSKSKSWFCVWNNPQQDILFEGMENSPNQMAEKALELWIADKPTRTGAVAYCISAEGLIHFHMVLEDSNMARFSALKNTYPRAHLEPTKGTKEQAEDYINKKGKFEDKGEQVIYIARFGEIKGNQGQRKDLDILEHFIAEGKTPNEILDMNLSYRRYEKYIKDAYFAKRSKETPFLRDINVIWHVGKSGSGKSYTAQKIIEQYGEDYLYFLSDYENGGFDNYCGEPVLFMDEFRGQLKFSTFLGILQGYKMRVHARYSNVMSLWKEVHITSVLPPELIYYRMVEDDRHLDTMKQLFRRINTIVYHYKDNGDYKEYIMAMEKYIDYEDLKIKSMSLEDANGFVNIEHLTKSGQLELPFGQS